MSGGARPAVARLLRWLADRLAPEPFFDLDAEPSADQWTGLVILHAENVHGCDHTGPAREAIGMYEPEPA